MNSKIQDYFLSLQSEDNPSVVEINQDLKSSYKHLYLNFKSNMGTITIKGRTFYIKPTREFSFNVNTEQNIAASKMYQNLGIITPTVYPAIITFLNNKYNTITEDVPHNLPNTIIKPATSTPIEDLAYYQSENQQKQNKWNILTSGKFKRTMLDFVTPECYEQLMKAFILGELRTDGDLHTGNFFLYKSSSSKKYEGIIVIDLEECSILNQDQSSYLPTQLEDVESFINNIPFFAYTPNQLIDTLTHKERMFALKQFIIKGSSTTFNQFIKKALTFDFPEEIRKAHTQCSNVSPYFKYNETEPNSSAYDTIAKLWEYNREVLGPELGL